MDYSSIYKIANHYERITIGAEEPATAVGIPVRPFESTKPSADILPFEPTLPSENQPKELEDFEYIPGYDNFDEALSRLRNAFGYAEGLKPVTYRIFAIRKLILDASRLIGAGMKQVYKATPADKLQASN